MSMGAGILSHFPNINLKGIVLYVSTSIMIQNTRFMHIGITIAITGKSPNTIHDI